MSVASDHGGYIKLYRSLLLSDLWDKASFTPGQAWVDLLLRANYRDGGVLRGVKVTIPVRRGQVYAPMTVLARDWGWNRKTVRAFLDGLEASRRVTIKTDSRRDTGGTLITICNYELYQSADDDALDIKRDIKPNSNGTATGQQRVTLKEGKKVRRQEDTAAVDAAADDVAFLFDEPTAPRRTAPTGRRARLAEAIDGHLAICTADIKRLESMGFKRAQVGDILVDAIEHASGSGNGDALLEEWAARWKRFMDSMDDGGDIEQAAEAFIEAEVMVPAKKPGNPLVALYAQLWKERYPGAPLSVTGADAGRLKQLGKDYGNHPGAAERIVRAFFASDDPFVNKSGHSTNVLLAQAKALLTGAKAEAIDNRRGFNELWAKSGLVPGSEVKL